MPTGSHVPPAGAAGKSGSAAGRHPKTITGTPSLAAAAAVDQEPEPQAGNAPEPKERGGGPSTKTARDTAGGA